MQRKRDFIGRLSIMAILAVNILFATGANAATKKTLSSFDGAAGSWPVSGVIVDGAGNLYGVAPYGGAHGGGAVYKVSVDGNGSWTQTSIYDFTGGMDGGIPYGALTLDGFGNLYGAAYGGGAGGAGVIFRLTPGVGPQWNETVIFDFGLGEHGANPAARVILGKDGSLYGTTFQGALPGCGVVFKLTNNGPGYWTETVLHQFSKDQQDGCNPWSGVAFDANGNLYGTTNNGGAKSYGVLYQLSPNGDGTWSEKLLHTFDPTKGKDGGYPLGDLLIDTAGNIFGTTEQGGKLLYYGTAYQLSPDGGGGWKYSIIHNFTNGADGGEPLAGLTSDAAGRLYGATSTGKYQGLVFRLALNATGKWAETVLYRFTGGADGTNPKCTLAFDTAGKLYGTTQNGGTSNMGTVFQVKP